MTIQQLKLMRESIRNTPVVSKETSFQLLTSLSRYSGVRYGKAPPAYRRWWWLYRVHNSLPREEALDLVTEIIDLIETREHMGSFEDMGEDP